MITARIYLGGRRRRRGRSEGRREGSPREEEEKRLREEIFVSRSRVVSIGRVFRGRLFLRSSRSSFLPSVSRELREGSSSERTRDAKDLSVLLERYAFAPSGQYPRRAANPRGSCVLINPGCARPRKRLKNYTIVLRALISRNYTGCGRNTPSRSEPTPPRSLIKCIACTHG